MYLSFLTAMEALSLLMVFLLIGISKFHKGDCGGINIHGNRGVILGGHGLVHDCVTRYEKLVFEICIVEIPDTNNFFSGSVFPLF